MEKKGNVNYRLALYSLTDNEGDVVQKKVMEESFDASCYHDVGVDIKHLADDFINQFKTVLSTKSNRLNFKYAGISLIPNNHQEIVKKTAFKYILYIDNNYIMERNFTVFNYNNSTKYSIELKDCFESIITDIKRYLKLKDIGIMLKEFKRFEWESESSKVQKTPVGTFHLNK